MSAKGKKFGVNVSATLDEAKAAGDNGILYIPESEQEGVIVFGGKEFAALAPNAKQYLVNQLYTTDLAAFTPTFTYSIIHRTFSSNGLSGMPTSYIEEGVKASFTGSEQNFITNGYQKITFTLKASYKNPQGATVNKEIVGNPAIKFSTIKSGVILKTLIGTDINGTLNDITTTSTIDLVKQSDNLYKVDIYISDSSLVSSDTALFSVSLFNAVSINSDYGITLTKSPSITTYSIKCRKSSWIVESSLTEDEITSKLTAGNIYAAPFLISANTTIRNTTIVNNSITLNSGTVAYVLISDETSFNSFTDSSGLISFTASGYFVSNVNVKFANGAIKTYKLYKVNIDFKNIK